MADEQIYELDDLEASVDETYVIPLQEPAGLTPGGKLSIQDLMRKVDDGSEAAPALASRYDPDTGLHWPASGQLAVGCNADIVGLFRNDGTDNYLELQANASQAGSQLRGLVRTAASVPGNFSADAYFVFTDSGGTARYVPCADAVW